MIQNFRAAHVAAASALALAVGGAAGYFLSPDGSGDKASATAKSSCPEIDTGDDSAQAFGRLAGSGSTVNSQVSEKLASTTSYAYSCSISVNGKSKLLLTADLAQSGSISAWRNDLADNGDIGAQKDRKTFPVGEKGSGISSPFSAAVYLECKPTGSTLRVTSNLSVEVTLLPRKSTSSSDRSDLAQVALSLATHAQSRASCEAPEKLPATPQLAES